MQYINLSLHSNKVHIYCKMSTYILKEGTLAYSKAYSNEDCGARFPQQTPIRLILTHLKPQRRKRIPLCRDCSTACTFLVNCKEKAISKET